MKVKRTCSRCNTVWYAMDGCMGCLWPPNVFMLIFNAIYGTLLTKGSAIDIEYMNSKDEKRKKTCPNCNCTIYDQENASMTCGEIGCLLVFLIVVIILFFSLL